MTENIDSIIVTFTKEEIDEFIERVQMGNYKIDSTEVYYKLIDKQQGGKE